MVRRFGLRVCRPMRPGEIDYKHCSNDIIKNCSAPCIGRITRDEYLARVHEACEFFEGRNKAMIAALGEEMQPAAENLEFERAGELRDMLEDFSKTLQPFEALHAETRAPRRHARGRCAPRCGGSAGRARAGHAPAGHGVLRHFEHLVRPHRRLDGAFQKWTPRHQQLPALPDQGSVEPKRFCLDG